VGVTTDPAPTFFSSPPPALPPNAFFQTPFPLGPRETAIALRDNETSPAYKENGGHYHGSHNHAWLCGGVGVWMYSRLGGIVPVREAGGAAACLPSSLLCAHACLRVADTPPERIPTNSTTLRRRPTASRRFRSRRASPGPTARPLSLPSCSHCVGWCGPTGRGTTWRRHRQPRAAASAAAAVSVTNKEGCFG
jgi:hypothetical protein